jgi:hypothetical protein
MAFHDHEMSFESFTDQHLSETRDMQHVAAGGGGGGSGAPTWLSNAILRQQNSILHLQRSDDGNGRNDDVHVAMMAASSDKSTNRGDRNRTESDDCEREERWEWESAKYKSDIVTHPLYEQLLSAHVACLRIATPVDQLPKIDAQLEQSQRVVAKYSVLANAAVDQKELDQFMVSLLLTLCFACYIGKLTSFFFFFFQKFKFSVFRFNLVSVSILVFIVKECLWIELNIYIYIYRNFRNCFKILIFFFFFSKLIIGVEIGL